MINVCVVGTGYVGLVVGVCLAEFGLRVICVDKDGDRIEALKKGEDVIHEPGLKEMLEKNLSSGGLSFMVDLEKAVADSNIIFITVGTPSRPDGRADISAIEEVASQIGGCMNDYKVVVLKSTAPVGTTKIVKEVIKRSLKKDVDFGVVSNPEFLREGSALEDFMNPDRVVMGSDSQEAVSILRDLYRSVYMNETPFIITNAETAELIKYASNAFLATKISFVNEVANLCEKLGADIRTVARGMGLDKRIGMKYLHAGPGFGGSCLPKDARALIRMAEDQGYDFKILKAVMEANNRQPEIMVDKIRRAVGGDLRGRVLAVLGLTFKPNTDDMRESPSIPIIKSLQEGGALVRAYDPAGMAEARKIFDGVKFCNDAYDAARGADAVIIVTDWHQFRNLDLERLCALMRGRSFVDLRNIYVAEKVRLAGFEYFSVG